MYTHVAHLGTFAVFETATPAAHLLAIAYTLGWPNPKATISLSQIAKHSALFPFAGGPRTLVFQIIAWCVRVEVELWHRSLH